MKTLLYIAFLSVLITSITSCGKKSDLLEKIPAYGTFAWRDNSVSGGVGVKYNDEVLEGQRVLAGPGKFTFYNKETGEVLLEKELDIKPEDNGIWYYFQPDITVEPQLLRNTQLNEPAPPDGYFKLKMANLAKTALPYKNLDVILYGVDEDWNTVIHDTLVAVGSQLDTAGYYLLKKSWQPYFNLAFIDHETQQPVLDKAGNLFISQAQLYTDGPSNIYTCYLKEMEYGEFDILLFRNNKYYDIQPTLLFE